MQREAIEPFHQHFRTRRLSAEDHMPGILGVVQTGMRPEAANRAAEKMIGPLLHFPWYQWAKQNWQGATLGVVSLGTFARTPRCLMSENRRYLLAFEGELYNAGALQQELGLRHLSEEVDDVQAAVVLHALMRWGAAALSRFNGLLQLALWDALEQELLVGGDRGGLCPIYYAQHKDKLAFAPEVKALLTLPWVSREINYQGLDSFLRYGFCTGQRTFFKDVQVLPPGAVAVFRQGRVEIRRYWKMDFQTPAQQNEKEMQQRFIDTWMEVMRDQTAGEEHLGLPLSGGVDSRLILSALHAHEREVTTFTIGNAGCKDAELAQRLAELAGYPNLFSPIVPAEAATSLERSVYIADGMFNCFHTNVQRLLPSLATTVNVVYDGITPLDGLYDPEDLWWRKLLRQTEPLPWLRAEVEERKLNGFRFASRERIALINAEAQTLFEPEVDFLGEFVRAQRGNASDAPAMLDLFWLEEFQHRFAAFGPHLLRTAVEVRCPFFDKRILELVAQMTPLQRSSLKPLQRHAIHALKPALARIPWERTGLPLTASFGKIQRRRATRALRRRAQRLVGREAAASSSKMIDYDEMMRTSPELQKKISAMLIDRWPEGSRLFNRRGLQTLLEEHMNRAGNYAEIIGRIFTVEAWHKQFVQETKSEPRVVVARPERVYQMTA